MQQRLSNPSKIVQLLTIYDIKPSKRFGQNYIADFNIVKKSIRAAQVNKKDTILEIGPGLGSLTEALLETGARVCAIELDRKLHPILQDIFKDQNRLKLIQADALKADLNTISCKPNKLVSNLPYNIAAPLLINYLHKYPYIEKYIVMIQKEVADRITAKPSTAEYGSLTVKIGLLAKTSIVGNVSRNSFIPKPNVDSAIIVLERKESVLDPEEREDFFKIVNAAFSKRRKTAINSLSSGLNKDKNLLAKMFDKCDINAKKRAQDLTISDFLKIFYSIRNY